MMATGPLVSVYIVTKNRRVLLEEAIESVFAQSYKKLDIIVVDDGSSDGTKEFLSTFAQSRKDNFRWVSFETSKGAPVARNKAIEMARGAYITGLDDDDRFMPDRVERFVHALSNAYPFLCSQYIYRSDKDVISNKPEGVITFDEMKCSNVVGNQIFIETEKLRKIGGFDEDFVAWQDYDLWFRLLKEYGLCYRISGATYIVDSRSAQDRISTSSNSFKGYQQFIEKHKASLSSREIIYQELNDLQNRKASIGIRKALGLICDWFSLKRLIVLVLKVRYPKLYYWLEVRFSG